MNTLKPIYGATIIVTERIIDIWMSGDKEKACRELMPHISVNKSETVNNTEQMTNDTIEKWIEDTF